MNYGFIVKMLFEAILVFMMLRFARYSFDPEKYSGCQQREQAKIFRRLLGLRQEPDYKPSKVSGFLLSFVAAFFMLMIVLDLIFLLKGF